LKVVPHFLWYWFGLKLASDTPDYLLQNVIGGADRPIIRVEHTAPILIDKLKTVDGPRRTVSGQYMHIQVAGFVLYNWRSWIARLCMGRL